MERRSTHGHEEKRSRILPCSFLRVCTRGWFSPFLVSVAPTIGYFNRFCSTSRAKLSPGERGPIETVASFLRRAASVWRENASIYEKSTVSITESIPSIRSSTFRIFRIPITNIAFELQEFFSTREFSIDARHPSIDQRVHSTEVYDNLCI